MARGRLGARPFLRGIVTLHDQAINFVIVVGIGLGSEGNTNTFLFTLAKILWGCVQVLGGHGGHGIDSGRGNSFPCEG